MASSGNRHCFWVLQRGPGGFQLARTSPACCSLPPATHAHQLRLWLALAHLSEVRPSLIAFLRSRLIIKIFAEGMIVENIFYLELSGWPGTALARRSQTSRTIQ